MAIAMWVHNVYQHSYHELLLVVLTLRVYACLIHGVCISVDPEDTSDQDLGKDVDPEDTSDQDLGKDVHSTIMN